MEAPARPWGLQAEVILGGLFLGEPSSLAGALVDPTSFHGNRAKMGPLPRWPQRSITGSERRPASTGAEKMELKRGGSRSLLSTRNRGRLVSAGKRLPACPLPPHLGVWPWVPEDVLQGKAGLRLLSPRPADPTSLGSLTLFSVNDQLSDPCRAPHRTQSQGLHTVPGLQGERPPRWVMVTRQGWARSWGRAPPRQGDQGRLPGGGGTGEVTWPVGGTPPADVSPSALCPGAL